MNGFDVLKMLLGKKKKDKNKENVIQITCDVKVYNVYYLALQRNRLPNFEYL